MINFDNTTQKIRRSRPQPFYDYGVKDRNVVDSFGSNASAGIGGLGGTESQSNGDSGEGDDPFLILINGTQPSYDPQGILIPASVFTITVNNGTYTYDSPYVDDGSGGTKITVDLELNTGLSANFPSGDGNKIYAVYLVIVFSKDSKGMLNGSVGSAGGVSTKIYVQEVAGSQIKTGLLGKDTANPYYIKAIGYVRANRFGLSRRVFVTQIMGGNQEEDTSSLGKLELKAVVKNPTTGLNEARTIVLDGMKQNETGA